jgi:hypothetical protein
VPVSGLAVYDDDESGHRFNARKTWGRLFGGIKLGAVVSHVTEELEKAGKKMHSRGLESTYIGRVDVGDSFGEGGLIRRRPSGRVVFCYFRGFRCILLPIFCVMNSVRHCTAVARYNCTLLVISVDDYMKLQETGLMTSECQRLLWGMQRLLLTMYGAVAGAGDEDVKLFSSLPWLRSLGHDSIVRLAGQAKKSTLPAGQIIVQEGEGARRAGLRCSALVFSCAVVCFRFSLHDNVRNQVR